MQLKDSPFTSLHQTYLQICMVHFDRAALTSALSPRQVGSYRIIVSYETPQLEAFSLCILQRHNCFNCDAKVLPPRTRFVVPCRAAVCCRAWRDQSQPAPLCRCGPIF